MYIVLATASILISRRGEHTYKQRLTTICLLPLYYERKIADLVFFFKAFHRNIDLEVYSFVSFVDNGRTLLTLKTPYCKSSTFQASYFNRIVKLGNYTCKILPSSSFNSLLHSRETLSTRTNTVCMQTLT